MAEPREAHLHVLRLDRFADETEEALLDRFGDLLTPEERERQARPTLLRRRREILLTRMLVRTVLSHHAGVDPREWRFGAAERGRPFIEHPALDQPLDFNLAHTEGMIVCLVSEHPGIGVDVEFLPRRSDLEGVAGHFFAVPEQAALMVLPKEERRARFFAYWTLKEAYIKARGQGLALPLDGFWFDLAGDEPAISFDDRIEDDPERWRFRTVELSPDHLCSVALPFGPGPRPELHLVEA